MGSVKEIEIITKAADNATGEGEFAFSDRYSVFDWGEMPDLIEGKGAALATLSSYFFDVLEKKGIGTHFIGLMEDGRPKKFDELKSFSNRMRVKILRVVKPSYNRKANSYDYSAYGGVKNNFLIPLEVIYRNELPEGSSVFKRLTNGSITFKDLGLDKEPIPGDVLVKPIIDVSTKLEHYDRYMGWEEAGKISGLNSGQVEKLKNLCLEIDNIISESCKKAQIKNVDGKFEFGMSPEGEIIVIDVLGTPDECRFLYGDFHISKEFARRWYRKTGWYKEVEAAKKEHGDDWKTFVKAKPEKLPENMKKLLAQMYQAVTNEITGKRFFEVPSLDRIIAELVKYDG
jgi:phosphoribosylaminoimidazole-succinocarboxamide synthase